MANIDDLSVPPEVQKINQVPHWIDFIPVEDTELESYKSEPDSPNEKAHLLLYLNSRHWSENKEEKAMYISGSTGLGASKKKQTIYKHYNRIAFFADCCRGGSVCSKLLQTHWESLEFFEHMAQGGFGVGWVYVVEEPAASSQHLGDSQSIILLQKASRVYPVQCQLNKVIPSVPLVRPLPGETRYFVYHNQKNLAIGHSVLQKSTCGGSFCDRQLPVESKGKGSTACGCFHTKDRYKVITEHSIRIPCVAEVNSTEFITIYNVRSLRFDKLIFQDGSKRMFTDNDLNVENPLVNRILRRHVKGLVTLVNGKSGWTVVGWVRTGKVKDANEEGNKDAIDIAAEDVSPHITYVYPTDAQDVDTSQVPEYKKLIISEATFRKEVHDEEEKMRLEEKKRKQGT